MAKLRFSRKIKMALGLVTAPMVAIILMTPHISTFTDFRGTFKLSQKYLFARDGRLISSFRDDFNKRNFAWFQLNEINPDFIKKLLEQEDHRFYNHPGLDPLALGRATFNYMSSSSEKRGASTITMQLAKNLYRINTKTLIGKAQQIVTALKIEARWSKAEILEAYLNLISVHADIQGVGSTSLALFNKSPMYINDTEQNLILKSIKAPNTILKNTAINKDDFQSLAQHYHAFLLKSKIYSQTSTLDYDLQNFAVQSIKMHLERLKTKNVHDGSIIVLDNQTGNVLAYVGGTPDTTQTPYVDMAQAERQLGSTLKPFLYSTALDQNILKISSWIEDSPIDIIFPNGTYSPKNHDQHFHGWVHIGTAIGSSLNVPAVKIIQLTGVDNFWNTLKKLNFNLDHDPDFYGPSLALGVLDGSLWQLTHAYQSFVKKNDVFTEATKERMIWILSRSQNRALSFGQDSILNVPQGFAVKTGTSKDMKDNWAVGFNRDFTIGVWVGNSDSSSMQNVLGVTGAAPVWREIVDYLMAAKLKSPSALLTQEQDQKFLTEEQSAEESFRFTQNSIISPAKNSIYAVDPSIPMQFQKIMLQADGDQNKLTWKYKGQTIKDGKWALKKGWQKIELYSNDKKSDETVFLVK